jgi:hypothetical protein
MTTLGKRDKARMTKKKSLRFSKQNEEGNNRAKNISEEK